MNVIFKREDFTLCKVPVPKGYPQSQTHAGVARLNRDYFLVTSPFPNIKYKKIILYLRVAIRKLTRGLLFNTPEGEYYENPCLYIGNTLTTAPPTLFHLMHQQPLMDTPERLFGLPTFNSDPDIFVENDEIYILNRSVVRTEEYKGGGYRAAIKLFLIRGRNINDHFSLEETFVLKSGHRNIISPCLSKKDGEYILVYLDTNSYNDGSTFKGLYVQKSVILRNLQSDSEIKKINVESCDYLPWHMSLFEYKQKIYTIIACVKKEQPYRCWQMLGEFDENMTELKIFQTPLTDYNSYRGAACVTDNGEFVLYNTTVHEKIKGSTSVDGRDVLMAHMPFDKLICTLQKERENE